MCHHLKHTKALNGTGIPQDISTRYLDHKPGKPYPYFWCKYILRVKYFDWPTFVPSQTKVQVTIITVTYTHKDLRDKKYQSFGWYGYTPGRTNPKFRSQTRQTVSLFLVQTQSTGKYYCKLPNDYL